MKVIGSDKFLWTKNSDQLDQQTNSACISEVTYLAQKFAPLLDYFAFWKFVERPSAPLKIGDKPEMLLLSVIPTETLLMKMCDPRRMTMTKDKFKIKIV